MTLSLWRGRGSESFSICLSTYLSRWLLQPYRQTCTVSALEDKEATYSHVKPQILLLLEEKIQDKLPHKIWIASVVNHLRPAKLHAGRNELALAAGHESVYTIKSENGEKKKKKLKERGENTFFTPAAIHGYQFFPVKISPLCASVRLNLPEASGEITQRNIRTASALPAQGGSSPSLLTTWSRPLFLHRPDNQHSNPSSEPPAWPRAPRGPTASCNELSICQAVTSVLRLASSASSAANLF